MAVNDQMEMALSESGRQDPVSGNDVPMGSLPEEVRDDVPAMLSEGEYVVPADVLRFYGLKFFEDLRENAKMEIAKMADEGRIGGEPVAGPGPTAPTPDQPNGLDLSPDDMQQLESVLQASEGGAVGFNVGGLEQGLDQSEQGGAVTQKASMNMEDDAKTDQLIDRIMGAVQKNPSLQQKLADKGVGFMEGGVVQGYAHGGDHSKDNYSADDWLSMMQQQQLNEAFNPYAFLTPGTGGGYGSSSFKTADTIQKGAAPTEAVKKKIPKEQPDGPDDVPMTPTFSKMSLEQQQDYMSKANDMINYTGPFSWAVNALGRFNKQHADKHNEKTKAYQQATIAKAKADPDSQYTGDGYSLDGTPGYGSAQGAANAAAAGIDDGTEGSGFTGPMNKGGFISRRKKT
jgi:hypothetical protein